MALPFDPADSAFSRSNALYLAHASSIAYNRAPAGDAREQLGLETFAFLNKVTRTRGYLGVCDTHAVLAFRGSEPIALHNWVTDAVVKLVACGEYDGRVHHGFSSALRRTWDKVEPLLDQVRGRPLFITGHSMGGALAILSGCRLAKLGVPPVATYTYGSPRIGDPAFCAGYALPTYRVVNRLDMVPEMPLAPLKRAVKIKNPKLAAHLARAAASVRKYEHVNTFVYLDRDGEIAIDGDVEPWHAHALARALDTRGKSFLDGITDHLITSYIRGLEGQPAAFDGKRLRLRANKSAT